MTQYRRTFAALLLSVTGCGGEVTEPEPLVSISPSAPVFAPGDQIRILLTNTSEQAIQIDQCFSALEREASANQWTAVGGRACAPPGESWLPIPSGGLVRDSIATAVTIVPGTYRIRYALRTGARRPLAGSSSASAPFRIE
jgi:hypothetical protein